MKDATRLPNARTENLVIRKLDDETLVYDMERDVAHCLNRTAALVWQQCDGKTTPVHAAQALGKELEAPVDADLIWLAVKQLHRFHLVERSTKSLSVSRRELVVKYAPAALALPLIVSITSPVPAQAASCSGPCSFNECPGGCICSDGQCVPDVGARPSPK